MDSMTGFAEEWEAPDGVDWPAIWSKVVALAETDAGKEEVAAARPLGSVEEVEQCMDLVEEAMSLLDKKPATGLGRRGSALPLEGILDVRKELEYLGKGGVPDEAALVRVAASVQGLATLQKRLGRDELRRTCPNIAAAWDARAPPLHPSLVASLASCVDLTGNGGGGSLSARAFPPLAAARQALYEALDAREQLQGGSQTDRGGAGKGGALGSAQIQERIEIAEGEFARAAADACRVLAGKVAAHTGGARLALEASAYIDAAHARALFARQINATRPLVRQEGAIEVMEARHPLLTLQGGRGVPAVGNCLSLSVSRPALLVTGPNGGGKSILLKTYAAFALLVAMGCMVPGLPGARVDLFRVVRASVGDAQDILCGASSFSAHTKELARMVEVAREDGRDALLLIDEICAGTDPGPGSALAVEVLSTLSEAGARVVATTHFPGVKTLVASNPRFAGAAMRWDASNSRPAFRAVYGVVGQSLAVRAARRQGLPERVVARAEELLGREHGAMVLLLSKAEEEAGVLQDLTAEVRQLGEDLLAAQRRVVERQVDVAVGVGRLRRHALARTDEVFKRGWGAVDEANAAAVRREESIYKGMDEMEEIAAFFAHEGSQPDY